MKKTIKKYKQVANYIIREIEISEGKKVTEAFIDVKTTAGNWAMRIYESLPLYDFYKEILDTEINKNQEEYVSGIIGSAYTMGTMVGDDKFYEHWAAIYFLCIKRMFPEKHGLTKKEDDEILNGVKALYEEMEQLKTDLETKTK